MNYTDVKRFKMQVIAPLVFYGITLFACGGVHNEPPAEIIRINGAGPSSRAAAETSNNTRAEETLQTEILDSSGNPINSEEKY